MTHTPNARLLPSGFIISISQEIAAIVCRIWLTLWGGYKVQLRLPRQLGHNQRYVIAANHQSMMDPFAIFALMKFNHRLHLLPLKFMTIPKIYHRPWVKPFAYLLGCFPAHIRDRNHHTYGIEGSIKLLHCGYNICMFPEGTRTLRADSNPKPGIARILSSYPDSQLILAHIEWRKTGWRRHLTLTVAMAPQNLDKSNPKAIMDAIYAL